MSQAHVASLLGTQQANISAYEAGTLTPGSVVEERMAELLAPARRHRSCGLMAGHLRLACEDDEGEPSRRRRKMKPSETSR
jgi:hypothetical protein